MTAPEPDAQAGPGAERYRYLAPRVSITTCTSR
jgi:hypothetical protein